MLKAIMKVPHEVHSICSKNTARIEAEWCRISLPTFHELSKYHFHRTMAYLLKCKMVANGHFVWALKPTPPFYDPQNLSFGKITGKSRKSNEIYSKYRQKTLRTTEQLPIHSHSGP